MWTDSWIRRKKKGCAVFLFFFSSDIAFVGEQICQNLCDASGVPTPLFRGSTPTRVGGSRVLPRKFFSFKVAHPPKINFQAAGLMLSYANKTYDTLKHCAVHKHHTFILGGDKVNKGCCVPAAHSTPLVNMMTFIFIQHIADGEGQMERLIEKQGVHSTVLQGGSSEEEFTSTAQVLLRRNHPRFVVETYHTFTFSSFVFSLYNSQAQLEADVDGSTPAQINHGKGARTGCHTCSSPKRTNCWGHADPVTSTPAFQPLK